MIDIHCHILPEVDDGPASWETALAMCRMAAADGIEHIVATPHANDRYHYDRPYLSGLRDHLQEIAGETPRLGLGCDFHMSYENLQDVMVNPDVYLIEGGKYLLVELSNFSIGPQIEESYKRMREIGITPIVTHPERNSILQRTPERVLQWVELGCAVQVTASAFTGRWGETAARMAEWLLKSEAIHVLATDAHNTKSRPPNLSAARRFVTNACNQDVARALVEDNPRAVVTGQPMPYFPKPVSKN
jgi:protein-tyrosine phosphatase